MPLLDFQSYEPTYIGKPVEAISNMLKVMDSNNQRISDSYRSLNTTLSQLDINDADSPIIADRKNIIDQRLNKAIESDDYSNIASTVKSIHDNVVNDPQLIAAVSRNKQYNDYRNLIANRYYKGDIDKDQYDYYYNRPFDPTLPDNNGVFNREYKLPNPAKALDIPSFAGKVLSTIMEDGGGREVNDYVTAGELASITGQDIGDIDPSSPSSFKKYSSYVTSRGVSRDKRRNILKSAFTTNPEARAYIDDITRIRQERGENITQSEIIDQIIDPYVKGSGYVTTEQERDNDMRFLYQQSMINKRAEDNRTYRNNKGEEESVYANDNADVIATLNIGQGVENISDDLETTFSLNTVSNNYNNFRFDPQLPNYSKEVFINNVAKSNYGKSFNELNQRERKDLILGLESKKGYDDNAKPVLVKPYKQEPSELESKRLFGGTSIKFKDGENATGIVNQRGLYDIQTGEEIAPNKVNEYLAEKYKNKDVKIRAIGDLSGDNPIVDKTGNFQYYNGTVVNINGDMYAVPGSYYNPTKTYDKFKDYFKKVEDGTRGYSFIQDPFGEKSVDESKVSHEISIARVPSKGGSKLVLQTNGKGKPDAKNPILRPQVFEASDSESLYMQYQLWVNDVESLYKSKVNNNSKVDYTKYKK